MSILDVLLGRDSKKAREEALRLGISVVETQHKAEVWERHHPTGKYESFECIKYSIPRTGASDILWSFDQVSEEQPSNPCFFKSPGAEGGYFLKINTPVSESMKRIFAEVAQEYSEEFFAFEGSATEVSIYWEEYGGEKQANRLYQTLKKLRDL